MAITISTGLGRMFLEFYNLREQPFGVTPDPRFLYLSPTHREALASLYFGVESGRGFMALIAEPGMGKTTLLYCLLDRLRDSCRTAFLFQTQCTSQDLLRHLVADLGVDTDTRDTVEMHRELNNVLVREAEKHRQVIVLIDEAQNLTDEVLESVRLLSNFETPSRKLIQVILAGQPPLADKLANPSLSQLCQRLSVMARLVPFSRAETAEYIRYRLRVSGYEGKDLFNPEAQNLIADLSGGKPREINNLCFNALSIGFALHKKTLDSSVVREAAADLDIASLGSERSLKCAVRSNIPPAPAKCSPATKPSGPDRILVPDVPPVFVTSVERGGTPRWALRAAIFCCAVLLALFLVPIRISDLKHLRAPSSDLGSTALAEAAFPTASPESASSIRPVILASASIPPSLPDAATPPAEPSHKAVPEQTGAALAGRSEKGKSSREDARAAVSRPAPIASQAPAMGLLRIQTVPSGAMITVDGQLSGKSPVEKMVTTGLHTYRIELPGYPPYAGKTNVRADVIEGVTVKFRAPTRTAAGKVDFRTIPPGARITVDDAPRGVTPLTLNLSAGRHRVMVSKSGYRIYQEMIEAQNNQTLRVYRILSAQ